MVNEDHYHHTLAIDANKKSYTFVMPDGKERTVKLKAAELRQSTADNGAMQIFSLIVQSITDRPVPVTKPIEPLPPFRVSAV